MTRAARLAILFVVSVSPTLAVAAPDLRVTSLDASPTTLAVGGRLAITNTVQSDGGASTAFVVKYYLSSDQVITSADTQVGSRSVSSPASGATSTATVNVTLPAGSTGPHYVGAIVDANAQVAESDETNNAAAGSLVEITRPDLTITALSATPTPIRLGGQLSISSTVRSTDGAAASFVIRFYLSVDGSITSSDTALGSRTVSSLASGASSTTTTNVTVPADLVGAYYVGAIVDADGQVAETDETNNVMAATRVDVIRPDLTVAALTGAPSALGAGGQLAITDTVQVSGSSVSSFVVRFYLSPDQAITSSDTLVGSRTVSSPVVGAPSTATTTVTLSTGLGGDLHLGAIVDAPSQIPESDEGDNASAGPVVAIGRTDLALTALASTPATLRAGGTLSIKDTVRATGGAAAASVLKFYLTPDSTITAADTLIGQRTVSALAAEGPGRRPRLRMGSESHHPPSSSEEGRPRAS